MKKLSSKIVVAVTAAAALTAGLFVAYAKEPVREPVRETTHESAKASKSQSQVQAPEPGTTKYFDNWGISCSDNQGQRFCSLGQELKRKEDAARLALLEVKPESDTKASAQLTLPFGLNVRNGVSMQVDNGPVIRNIAFSTCYQQGCQVPMTFDKSALDVLRSGKILRISAPLVSGETVNFELTLPGFAQSYDYMLKLAGAPAKPVAKRRG